MIGPAWGANQTAVQALEGGSVRSITLCMAAVASEESLGVAPKRVTSNTAPERLAAMVAREHRETQIVRVIMKSFAEQGSLVWALEVCPS